MRETAEREIVRADRVATAATKNAFNSWCYERTFTLCEEYAELFREQVDEVELALRIIAAHPHALSEREQSGWKKRNTEIRIALFHLSFEIGLFIQSDKYLPFVLRRWRDSQLEKHI